MSPRFRFVGCVAASAAVLLVTGYWLLFSHFAIYDDESYILLSAREYFTGGQLYDRVYSQYGPSFYVLTDVFQWAFGLVNHTSARLLTLMLWLGTAGGCAAIVARFTASIRLTCVTLAATFLYLYFFIDEPFHPGAVITFVLAVSVWLIAEFAARDQWRSAAITAGIATTVLLLAKINVGVFYATAVTAWAALNAASARWRFGLGITVAIGLLAMACALMGSLLHQHWIHIYLTVFGAGTIGLVLVVQRVHRIDFRHATWFFIAALFVAIAILGAIWLRGTSVAGLIEGVWFGPLQHAGNYSYAVDWRPGTILSAALSLSFALSLPTIRRHSPEAADRIVIVLRIVQVAGLLFAFLVIMHLRVIGAVFSYVAPLIWIWVVPLDRTRGTKSATIRGLLATVLLLQYLHAYPVGGSQESWGTFLFLPLVALGLHDIKSRIVVFDRLSRLLSMAAAGALTLFTAKALWTAYDAHRTHGARNDLGLPGARQLRLPEDRRTAYRLLAYNAVTHADTLFSLPGLFGFNLWTDLPTPTRKNTTLWFTLLNADDQQAIQASIERSPDCCIIIHEPLLEMTTQGGIVPRGPLIEYLLKNFHVAFRVDGFAFLVKNGRSIAPLGLARASLQSQIDVCLASPRSPVASIEIRDLASPAAASLLLDDTNARLTVSLTNRYGKASAGSSSPWPLSFSGFAYVSINLTDHDRLKLPARAVLRFRDRHGETVAEARFGG